MRITFAGASHGVPEPNRKCSCAAVETQGKIYFIDMGTSGMDYLVTRGIPPEKVKAVFVTHMHGDHTDGLVQFVDLASWYFGKCNPGIYLPDVRSEGVLKELLKITGIDVRDGIKFSEVPGEGVIYDDGTLRVTAQRTLHCNGRSYAYLVEAEGKSVLFSGDLNDPDKDFPSMIKGRHIDLGIFEGAHNRMTKFLPHFAECDIGQICVNHYAPWNIPYILEVTEALKDKTKVFMANDGMEIIL